MLLHWSPKSPFVRKVSVVLFEKKQYDVIERVRSVAIYNALPNPQILKDNPLGKIPVLVTDEKEKLFDSRVICEYLNDKYDGIDLFQNMTANKYRHLTWQALGDGLTDILLLWRLERKRGKFADPIILKAFEQKTRCTFSELETQANTLVSTPFGIGHISIICAIEQLNFRFVGSQWEQKHPNLLRFYQQFSNRESFVLTRVVLDTPEDQEFSDSPFEF